MKKIIIKTALITLAGIIAVGALLYGALAIFYPKTLSNFYAEVGNEKSALKYVEKAFEKSQDDECLKKLLFLSASCKEDEKLEKYFLLYKQNSKQFLQGDDLNHIAGSYCVVLCKKGETEKAISEAELYFSSYSKSNPFRHIIAFGFENKNEQLLKDVLKSLLLNYVEKGSTLNEQAKILLQSDIKSIESFLSNLTE